MKKILILICTILVFVSCKKRANWDCTCEIKPVTGAKFLAKEKYPKTTKSIATAGCENVGESALITANKGASGGTYRCVIQESSN